MNRGRTEQWRSRLEKDLDRLLAGCAEDDPEAWVHLLEAVRQWTMYLALRQYRLSREDAEDLSQIVQLRVVERLPQLRRRQAFPLWVRRVIHHLALDLLRQQHAELSLDDPTTAVWGAGELEVAAHHYDQALLKADLERALFRLPERYREPIRLHLLQGLSQEEVGRLLGRPRSTVATQIERGLTQLRRALVGSFLALSG